MGGILVYVLHYEGAFNKNSLGAVSEGAKLAGELGTTCDAVVVGGADLTNDLCATLGTYGAKRVFKAEGAEGLAQPVVDVMAQGHRPTTATATRCSAAACSASRSAPASPRASTPA